MVLGWPSERPKVAVVLGRPSEWPGVVVVLGRPSKRLGMVALPEWLRAAVLLAALRTAALLGSSWLAVLPVRQRAAVLQVAGDAVNGQRRGGRDLPGGGHSRKAYESGSPAVPGGSAAARWDRPVTLACLARFLLVVVAVIASFVPSGPVTPAGTTVAAAIAAGIAPRTLIRSRCVRRPWLD